MLLTEDKNSKIKPSVINQLKAISKNLQDLEYYECHVCGTDYEDAICYSKLQDTINNRIKELEDRIVK